MASFKVLLELAIVEQSKIDFFFFFFLHLPIFNEDSILQKKKRKAVNVFVIVVLGRTSSSHVQYR